jgi:hypothetical protein
MYGMEESPVRAVTVASSHPHDTSIEVRVAVASPFKSVEVPQRKASIRMHVPPPTDAVRYFTATICDPEPKPAVITLSAVVVVPAYMSTVMTVLPSTCTSATPPLVSLTYSREMALAVKVQSKLARGCTVPHDLTYAPPLAPE